MTAGYRQDSRSASEPTTGSGADPSSNKRQPAVARKIPQRTCVGCHMTSAKREFVRIVRTPLGQVEIDPTGKKSGRGAYLCLNASCWDTAIKKKRLESALKTHLAQDDAERLRQYAAKLPADRP